MQKIVALVIVVALVVGGYVLFKSEDPSTDKGTGKVGKGSATEKGIDPAKVLPDPGDAKKGSGPAKKTNGGKTGPSAETPAAPRGGPPPTPHACSASRSSSGTSGSRTI